jgi:ABC-2 type transport system permease protein
MRSIRLLFWHSYFMSLDLARQPMYIVSTVLFPSMFFWFFGVPNAKEIPAANLLTGSFAAYAVLGVVLFQFGVGIAQERASPWSDTLRTLSLPSWIGIFSRIVSGFLFSLLAVGGVLLTAHFSTPADLSLSKIGSLSAVLLTGAIPFALMGITIGYSVSAQSALPVANLIYLPLSFAGGLWLPPNALPKIVQDISPYLPTRMYGEVVWAVMLEKEYQTNHIVGLLSYSCVFLVLALYLYRKER